MEQVERTPYTLKEPLRDGSQMIEVLNFRKPRAKDIFDMPAQSDKLTPRHMCELASKLCGQPMSILENMSIGDLMEVSSIVEGFMVGGHPTGETSSL